MRESEVRFAFGRNWQRFLRLLNDQRIAAAEESLRNMLEIDSLKGKSFIDVGSGSGLFSLAAMRLGAEQVHSFDYDPQSVDCAQELKRRYFCEAGNWTIEQGSVLDPDYLARLGQFDVVYSWGVLHHTGDMWRALGNVVLLVFPGGRLFVAIYNDEGMRSRIWATIKRMYSRWAFMRPLLILIFAPYFFLRGFAADVLLRRRNPFARYRSMEKQRGMAFWPDLLDWLGGYPFEVATPGAILDFSKKHHLKLVKLRAQDKGSGNNEYMFVKCSE